MFFLNYLADFALLQQITFCRVDFSDNIGKLFKKCHLDLSLGSKTHGPLSLSMTTNNKFP